MKGARWALAGVLLVAACGSDDGETDETAPRTACEQAMWAAAQEPDAVAAEPLIQATLTACETTNRWVQALSKYPAALGLAEGVGVSDLDIQVACRGRTDTPMCADAAAKGKLD